MKENDKMHTVKIP